MQIAALKAAGAERKAIFTDKISGVKSKRPGLDRCLDGLRRGDVLLVWRVDRLGRTVKLLIALKDRLDAMGVELRSLSESFDTSTANGRFSYHLFAAIAQHERDLIGERTRAGLKEAVARGSKPGRRPCLDAGQIQEALILLEAKSRKHVAEHFGVSPTTIRRLVVNGGLGK